MMLVGQGDEGELDDFVWNESDEDDDKGRPAEQMFQECRSPESFRTFDSTHKLPSTHTHTHNASFSPAAIIEKGGSSFLLLLDHNFRRHRSSPTS